VGDGLPEFGNALGGRVAGLPRCHGLLGGGLDVLGCVEVRFADAQIDHVDPLGLEGGGLVADRERRARFHALYASCEVVSSHT
jgi:hypothetical protein